MKRCEFGYFLLLVMLFIGVVGCEKDDPIPEEQERGKAGCFVDVIESYFLTGDEVIDELCDGIGMRIDPDIVETVRTLILKPTVKKDVVVTKIEYLTEAPDGRLVTASGTIVYSADVERTGQYDRLVSVQPVTNDIDYAPSSRKFYLELSMVFKEDSEDIVILSDYLGYGSSQTTDLQTAYMHAGCTGSGCADMLKAAESYLKFQKGMKQAGSTPIVLCGYSQGAQATIATLYELQNRGYTDRIADVRAGSGPYDLNAFMDMFRNLDGREYVMTGFIPYMIRGIMYGEQLEFDLHKLLAPEVFLPDGQGKAKADLFTSTMLSTWHELLGSDVTKVLHPDFFRDESGWNEELISFLAAVDRNSVINSGTPVHPEIITLYHERNDDMVPYEGAVRASEKWGCPLIELEIADDNHAIGVVEFFLRYISEKRWNAISSLLKLLPNQ